MKASKETCVHSCTHMHKEVNAAFKRKSVASKLRIHEDLRNSVTDVVMIYVDMNVDGAQEQRHTKMLSYVCTTTSQKGK